jgi:hypothetical protein
MYIISKKKKNDQKSKNARIPPLTGAILSPPS